MIELFEHNRIAYDSAVTMLSDTGTKQFAGFHPLNISSKHNLRTWQRYQTAMFPQMSGFLPMPS